MEENKKQDGLVKCPHCGSGLCYAQRIGNEETWMCLACGYTSTTLMKAGSETEKKVTAKQPKLYREQLRFVDINGYVWYPAVLTVPDKGMVYIDGSTPEDWQWTATPMREITFKERRMKKFKGQKYVADIAKTQHFGKEGFAEAALAIGLYDKE